MCDNRKIGFILQKQRQGKKEVTTWWAALNFILIDLAENQSYCLCNYRGMKWLIARWRPVVNFWSPVQNF